MELGQDKSFLCSHAKEQKQIRNEECTDEIQAKVLEDKIPHSKSSACDMISTAAPRQ